MVYVALLLFLHTYHHETSYKDSQWVEDVPYGFGGQKVKGQDLIALLTEMVYVA